MGIKRSTSAQSPSRHINRVDFPMKVSQESSKELMIEDDERINEEGNISTGSADWISSNSTKAQTRKGTGISKTRARPLQGASDRFSIILFLSAIV